MKHSRPNIILLTDSYKLSHSKQYPKNTTKVYSYLESRGGKWENTIFFGLQYYLKEYLQGDVLEQWMIDEAFEFAKAHFGNDTTFNREGWQRLLDKHGGVLPVRIKAVAEGTVIPVKNVLATVENTDDEFPWLTNVLETLLLKVWYPITVATQSREIKIKINESLEKSGDQTGLLFKCHDFSYRGVSSEETAGIGAASHLVNFMGTDTIAGILLLRDYYDGKMTGFSIPASEHSTITSWGKDREVEACRNMLIQYPTGLVACVSDSWNIFYACNDIWGGILRDEVLSRDGTLVIRPDSGDPVIILPTLLDILWDKFGGIVNSKGYKVLDSHVRLIWGDGIDVDSIPIIISAVLSAGYSMDNLAFGAGAGLCQKVNRDTLKFAFKCSYVVVNGKNVDVFKDPITDPGKASKKGRLALVCEQKNDCEVEYRTIQEKDDFKHQDLLRDVFLDGKVLVNDNIDLIIDRAKLK